MKKIFIILLSIGLFMSYKAWSQCTCTSTGVTSGWSNANTWSCVGSGCGTTPRLGHPYDAIVIEHNVFRTSNLTLNGGVTLTINNGGYLDLDASLFNGNWGTPSVTINSGGTLDVQSQIRLYGADAFTNNGTINTNIFTINGGGASDIVNTGVINVSSNMSFNVVRNFYSNSGEINVGGNLTLGSASSNFDIQNTSINVTGDLNVTGSAIFDTDGAATSVGGDFNNSGAVDVNIDGTFDVTGDFNNTGSSNVILDGPTTIGGSVVGTGATFIQVNDEMTVATGINISGSAYINGSGIVGWNTFNTDNSGSSIRCVGGDEFDTDGGTAPPTPPYNPLDLNTCGQALPVEFVYFNASEKNGDAILEWATSEEKFNDYFEIQKSIDGVVWQSIATINGAGNSNELLLYSFIDENFEGQTFYRIKQVDFDNHFDYSNVVSLGSSNGEITVYPNPVTDGAFTVTTKFIENAVYKYDLFSLDGKLVLTGNAEVSSIDDSFTIISPDNLASGVYVLHVSSNNYTSQTTKLEIK